VEIKTPGIGVPGAIAVIALALFFWSSYLADLANFLEVGVFILGVLLLLLEIFVIPGFGLTGVAGIVLIIGSLVMAMIKLPPPEVPGLGLNLIMVRNALFTIVIVFIAFVPLAWAAVKFLPTAPVFRHLVLHPALAAAGDEWTASERGEREEALASRLIGASGTALTDLRPAGTALIAGRRLDVVTEGDYISKGEPVRVTDVQGNVHIVERAAREETV
jgi:membrane-bound serine protease (ClpP class)